MGADAAVSPVLAIQLAQALLTALVLWVFQRRMGYPVLATWTYAWIVLAVELLARAAYPALAATRPATDGRVIALTALALAAEYLKAAWLTLGAFAVAERRVRPEGTLRWSVVAVVALIVATMLPFATTDGATVQRYLVRGGTMLALTSVAQLATGVLLWLQTMRAFANRRPSWLAPFDDGPALGQRLVAGAFEALGVLGGIEAYQQLQDGSADPARLDRLPLLLPVAPAAQVLLNFALGLGLVIWLLEGEQRRTLEAAQRAEHMAYHDALTGLPNRLLLIDRLRVLIAQGRRTDQPFALFFLDVDHFKTINDTLGHAAGDRLLQQVAARLSAQLRDADTVARLGGDEFVILAPDVRTARDVAALGEKLRDTVRGAIVVDDREVCITVSIGASVFPTDGDDADALLRLSDQALYQAKAGGRDAVRLA